MTKPETPTDLFAASADRTVYVEWSVEQGRPVAVLDRPGARAWLAEHRPEHPAAALLAAVDQTGTTDLDGAGGWDSPVPVWTDPAEGVSYEVPRTRLREYAEAYLSGNDRASTILVAQAVPWAVEVHGSTRAPERRWLLWDVERGAWWQVGDHGYTLDITKAKRWSRAAAFARSLEPQSPDCELLPVPAPAGRVPLPFGLDTPQLVELAKAIDEQAATGRIVQGLTDIRWLLALQVDGCELPGREGPR